LKGGVADRDDRIQKNNLFKREYAKRKLADVCEKGREVAFGEVDAEFKRIGLCGFGNCECKCALRNCGNLDSLAKAIVWIWENAQQKLWRGRMECGIVKRVAETVRNENANEAIVETGARTRCAFQAPEVRSRKIP
jgi:hypothetical protein